MILRQDPAGFGNYRRGPNRGGTPAAALCLQLDWVGDTGDGVGPMPAVRVGGCGWVGATGWVGGWARGGWC
jgi:hypothetical protein